MRKEGLPNWRDMVFRSYDPVQCLYIISSERLWPSVQCEAGVDLGLLRDVQLQKLNELLVETRQLIFANCRKRYRYLTVILRERK